MAYLDTFIIEFGQPVKPNSDEKHIVESMPRFPGCEDMEGTNRKKSCASMLMMKYIYKNISYPQEAKGKNIQGIVVVSFVVEKDGSIVEVKVIRDKGAGLGEEAMRIVESFNDMDQLWVPGFQRGDPVRVQYNLPINFRYKQINKCIYINLLIIIVASIYQYPLLIYLIP